MKETVGEESGWQTEDGAPPSMCGWEGQRWRGDRCAETPSVAGSREREGYGMGRGERGGLQPGAAACHCWRQLIVEASRH